MTAVYPYATQATGWSSWAESLLTEASALTPATLLAGQSGGVLDDHISELTAMKNAAERISDSAYTTAKVAGVQDQFDRALAAAPSEGEVKEAEHAAERVRLQQKYAQPRQGDQAIINRAGFLREDRDAAIKQHARDTATTQWPSVPESGYTASPTAPSGPPNTYGPNGIGTDGEPPWGTEDKETPAGTRLSSANTPNASTGVPLMTAAQAPQPTATSAPTNTTPGITPTAAWTPPATKPKSTIGDKDGVRERPGRETPETTPGTSPSADRGSVIHGVTKGDVSGAGQNMLGQTARIGDSTVASNQGRMGGTGMMPGMMGGLGGQPSGRGRSGDRPEVLTSDPNLLGTVDDENSFDGGLIGSGDPRFDDVLFGPTRAEIEARENPHLVSRR
ncbi:hypothetical protein [Mycolicibacterium fallax]|uniref:Uncharacterized protein n=1 Tax=Mycolicibacterium fallax TaxID=1793 RepID=A0A1X1RJ07_MYCFA|nr:hypothetical protein [Mycolicibacterium fallax]MCB0929877.1 hypothetical protein [Mycobacterium sp.]ORV07530.1 hypothetical protein AWC04_03715 [Mycolicibacterium fallax]BBY99442.1 hypothetical protein MFAL_29090 [Mycolicibacterium fallax]